MSFARRLLQYVPTTPPTTSTNATCLTTWFARVGCIFVANLQQLRRTAGAARQLALDELPVIKENDFTALLVQLAALFAVDRFRLQVEGPRRYDLCHFDFCRDLCCRRRG
jgi:hypothetical protein